jgi:hypothetical protein
LYNLSIEEGLKKISTKNRDTNSPTLTKKKFFLGRTDEYKKTVIIKYNKDSLSALKKTNVPAKQIHKILKKFTYLKFSK